MLAAHASYSRCGLGTKETDLLVELAMEQSGVAGAKITGGGSGGTVCILCPSDREAAIAESVAGSYEKHTGTEPRVIQGTSPGALSTPVRLLQVRQRRF
jgi:galactokinase